MEKYLSQKIGIKGIIHALKINPNIDAKSEYLGQNVFAMLREVVQKKNKPLQDFLIQAGILLDYKVQHNLIATAGRTIIARVLSDDPGYAGGGFINYGLLGTGVAPVPANNATQLVNEVYRKPPTSKVFDANTAYIDFFYEAGDTNGNYTEFGNVIDGLPGTIRGSFGASLLQVDG